MVKQMNRDNLKRWATTMKAEHNNCRMRAPESELEASSPTVKPLKASEGGEKWSFC